MCWQVLRPLLRLPAHPLNYSRVALHRISHDEFVRQQRSHRVHNAKPCQELFSPSHFHRRSVEDIMEGKEFVSFSDTGDRTILVGEAETGQRMYKVQSLLMTMTSPVWKVMLAPGSFLEGNPDVLVELPDDDPDALLILLRILHFQNDLVPKELPSFDCLVEIAVLCDKYDTVNVVRPYLENWMSPWIQFCFEPGYEHWLFVAWTFGCPKIFDALAASLVLDAEVHSDGKVKRSKKLVSSESVPRDGTKPPEAWISHDDLPAGILEKILEIRENQIKKLVNLFQVTIDQIMKNTLCQGSSHDKEDCCTLMLGHFTKALYPIGLGSQNIPASNVQASIRNIACALSEYPFSCRFRGFKFCDLGKLLSPKVEKIMEEIPSAVTDYHKCHIDDQAKKSGVVHLQPPSSEKWTWPVRCDRKENSSESDSDDFRARPIRRMRENRRAGYMRA